MDIIFEETTIKSFNEIKIRKPVVKDLVVAERIAGSMEGLNYALALISQVATFDGEKLPPEEIHNMGTEDFLQLSEALMKLGLGDLAKQLSSSQNASPSNA